MLEIIHFYLPRNRIFVFHVALVLLLFDLKCIVNNVIATFESYDSVDINNKILIIVYFMYTEIEILVAYKMKLKVRLTGAG